MTTSLRITRPRDGDVLTRHDGVETAEALTVTVRCRSHDSRSATCARAIPFAAHSWRSVAITCFRCNLLQRDRTGPGRVISMSPCKFKADFCSFFTCIGTQFAVAFTMRLRAFCC